MTYLSIPTIFTRLTLSQSGSERSLPMPGWFGTNRIQNPSPRLSSIPAGRPGLARRFPATRSWIDEAARRSASLRRRVSPTLAPQMRSASAGSSHSDRSSSVSNAITNPESLLVRHSHFQASFLTPKATSQPARHLLSPTRFTLPLEPAASPRLAPDRAPRVLTHLPDIDSPLTPPQVRHTIFALRRTRDVALLAELGSPQIQASHRRRR